MAVMPIKNFPWTSLINLYCRIYSSKSGSDFETWTAKQTSVHSSCITLNHLCILFIDLRLALQCGPLCEVQYFISRIAFTKATAFQERMLFSGSLSAFAILRLQYFLIQRRDVTVRGEMSTQTFFTMRRQWTWWRRLHMKRESSQFTSARSS